MGFFSELKRRNVYRVGIAYAVTAWLLAQVAELALDAFAAPPWVMQSLLIFLVVGFPIALVLAWAYEVTPQGIRKEQDVDRSVSITHQTGRKINALIIVLLVLACGFLLLDKFYLQPNRPGDAHRTAGGEITIAVLPFENRSAQTEDQFFVDGIHEDLLTQVSRIRSWNVISRTSVERFRNPAQSIPEIGALLGATHIIEGAVQRSGERVRITMQLIDVATDHHQWANNYDRELTAANLFAIQSEIAEAVAAELRTTLSSDEKNQLRTAGTQSLEAYEAYLKGRERWRQRTAESVNESVLLFRQAIEHDPRFAAAYVGLSDAYRFQVAYSGVPGEIAFPKAEQAIRKAIELDDQSGQAYAALGALMRFTNHTRAAEEAFSRALELNPNYAMTYNWYGILLGDVGRNDLALEMYDKALQLDPLSNAIRSNIAYSAVALGNRDLAVRVLEEQIALFPESSIGYSSMGMLAVADGQFADAVSNFRRALAIDNNDPFSATFLTYVYLNLGDEQSVRKRLDNLSANEPNSGIVSALKAQWLLMTGDPQGSRDVAGAATRTRNAADLEDASDVLLRLQYFDLEDVPGALDHYRRWFPEILTESPASLHYSNLEVAADIAFFLSESGESERAQRLASQIIDVSQPMPLAGPFYIGVARAKAYTVLNRPALAVETLQAAIEAGWRPDWWFYFDYDPVFGSIRGDPEFQSLRELVAADMAEQLARVREMEASGEW